MHSSRPSTTTNRGWNFSPVFRCTGSSSVSASDNLIKGATRSSNIWVWRLLLNKSIITFCRIVSSRMWASPWKDWTNWTARVGIKRLKSFLFTSALKLAARSPFVLNFSASVCAKADFPAPAPPNSQKKLDGGLWGLSWWIQSSSFWMICRRVASAQRGGSYRLLEFKREESEPLERSESSA